MSLYGGWIYAQLVIDHTPGVALAAVPSAVNAVHDPRVLSGSQYPSAGVFPPDAPGLFAGETLSYQIICFATSEQLQVIVEAREGSSLKEACQDVWGLLRKAIRTQDPRLRFLKLIDPRESEPVAKATIGLRPQLARSETKIAVYPGGATVLIVVILWVSDVIAGHRLGDVVIGAAPAVVVALVALVIAAHAAYSHTLVWEA